jgi:drug/metabolite transporter (DMT)-like permease
MSLSLAGSAFALGAALCWAIGPLIAYRGVQLLGTFRFSMYRFTLSALVLFLIAFSLDQLQFDDVRTLALLALSGVIGVAIGEAALFQAVYLLGPRRSSLIFTLHAPLTAITGSLIFNETPSSIATIGVMLAFAGVYIAVIFRSAAEKSSSKHTKAHTLKAGLFLVILAVLCQIVGVMLVKEVISNVEPFFASFVRTGAACIAFLPIFFLWRGDKEPENQLRSLRPVALSALVSTIGGMTFLLAAFASTDIVRAVIFSSLSPVFYIILMSAFRSERFPLPVWFGTTIAVSGVVIATLSS